MKRLLSLVLALLMVATLFSGAMAEQYDTTLTVMIFERGNTTATYGSATDNYWTRWVQSEFGDPNGIKVEYVPVPRAEETAKINTMMASDSAPDIIFSYDSNMMLQYGADGGLVELTDVIDQYGPNIKEHLSDALPYGNIDGNQWTIVAKRTVVAWQNCYIRKDWLDEVGYELAVDENGLYHMSVDDFTTLLHQFKDMDPEGSGLEMYPLGMAGAYTATQTRPIIFSFINLAEMSDEYHACYNELFWPGYKEGVRYLNGLYNEGLVDPDFMVDTDTSYTALYSQFTNGRTLAFAHDYGCPAGVKTLFEEDPDAEVVAFYLDNVNGEQFNRIYAPTGMHIAVPATCEHPDAAIKYLDWLADWNNAKVFYYGFEGVHYNLDGDTVKYIEYTAEEKAASEYDFERITTGDMMLVYNGQPFGYQTSLEGLTDAEVKRQLLQAQSAKVGQVGGHADYYFQGKKTAAQEEYAGFLPGLTENLPLLISCHVEEFDETYDKVLNDYLAAGGQQVIDDQIKLYQELEAQK